MEYVRLGSSGLEVSRIGLGMMSYGDPSLQPWALREEEAEPIVRAAVESGVTLFDTADMYSDGASEEITGRLLSKMFANRDDYVLATKVYYPTGPGPNDRGLSRKHVLSAIRRLSAATRDRLRRPLSDPPLRLRHPGRGDDASPR